ncbi:MAG: DASS family sodium-coupled anion symporter [Chitinophagales bacterium]|nr:DASS family sodium-coupled anion symporter [Chitinophagales bacterium]
MKWFKIIAFPILGFLVMQWMQLNGMPEPAARMSFLLIWIAGWWMSEAVDLAVTSLIPFIFFPLLGIMSADKTAVNYMEQTIFLFIGGFFLAYAMEKWNLHSRMAFKIILLLGNKPSRILLGIMVTTYLITMWISNTATTIMLFSAVLAIIRNENLFHKQGHKRIAAAYMLALAYSASIGGFSTLVGTPPNIIFIGFYEKMFPSAESINFFRWFVFAFPVSFSFFICAYFVLRFWVIGKKYDVPFDIQHIKDEYNSLGNVSREEKSVMTVFFITVILWFTRADIDFGNFKMTGWVNLFGFPSYIKDSTVAILAGFTLFLIPASKNKKQNILEWKDVTKLPFKIILLFGCGFAIAEGFETTGLDVILASNLVALKAMPPWIIILSVVVFVTLLSEMASNVASVQLILPILMPLSVSLDIDPLTLMIPATIAASFGYMLPVATAANTIVFGSGYIDTKTMYKVGFIFNVIGITLLTLFSVYRKF